MRSSKEPQDEPDTDAAGNPTGEKRLDAVFGLLGEGAGGLEEETAESTSLYFFLTPTWNGFF